MAAKPKLSPEGWKHARDVWELDARKGFVWLIKELSLPVSAEAVRLKSKNEAWKKSHKPSLENQKTKLGKSKKKQPSTEAKKKRNTTNVRVARTDVVKAEEVDEESDSHGNSKYCCDYNDQAYKLCLLGATDKELADFFGVTEQTINNWKKDHPDFFESIMKGKTIADAEVAESTFKSATGKHFVTEDKVVGFDVQETKRQVPPDVAAQRMWLFNRRPKEWKNKVELKEEIDLNIFPSKEVLDEVYENALNEAAQRNVMLTGRRERLGIVIEHDGDDVVDV